LLDSDKGRGGDWVPNLVIGCSSVADEGHGFWISNSFCTNLVGCQTYQAKGHGYLIDRASNSTCLSGCRAYQGYQNGIMVDAASELNVSSTIICWNKGNGIECRKVVWGTITANEFIDNGARTEPRQYGVLIRGGSRGLQVSGNAIFNWPGHQPMIDGIHEEADCADNHFTANNVNHFKGEGVVSLGSRSLSGNNLVSAKAYEHPDNPGEFPLVDGERQPATMEEFSGDRMAAFLKDSRVAS
ncbi:MAG: right-handed parallel beta-helix repeat-containing protein, partial [Chthoniobacterales bacterium]